MFNTFAYINEVSYMSNFKINDEGVAEGVVVRALKPNTSVIRKLAKIKNISEGRAEDLLQYNVFTPKTLAYITGRSIHTINNHLLPKIRKAGVDSKLKKCFPFSDEFEGSGPIFIYRDFTCERYIGECLELE